MTFVILAGYVRVLKNGDTAWCAAIGKGLCRASRWRQWADIYQIAKRPFTGYSSDVQIVQSRETVVLVEE